MDRDRIAYAAVVEVAPGPIDLLTHPGWRLLVALAARRWGVHAAEIIGPSRDTLVVTARHHAMWLMRTHTGLSLPKIGRLIGGRDHSTVVSGIRQHEARRRGERPTPYVWSNGGYERFRRLLTRGSTPREAGARLGLTDADLMRCPNYHQLRREAQVVLRNRMVQRAMQRKADAEVAKHA